VGIETDERKIIGNGFKSNGSELLYIKQCHKIVCGTKKILNYSVDEKQQSF